MRKTLSRRLIAGASVLSIMTSAQAATQGLYGEYYQLPSWPTSVADAEIAGLSGPTATFIANEVCFPTCNATAQDATTTLDQFLAANASDVSANSIQNLSSHALVLTGESDIAKSGSQSVSLYSNDGADLYVDGKLVANDDGVQTWQGVATTVSLSGGWHDIKIVEIEDGGYSGLTARMDGQYIGGSQVAFNEAPLPPIGSTVGGLVVLVLGCLWCLRRTTRVIATSRSCTSRERMAIGQRCSFAEVIPNQASRRAAIGFRNGSSEAGAAQPLRQRRRGGSAFSLGCARTGLMTRWPARSVRRQGACAKSSAGRRSGKRSTTDRTMRCYSTPAWTGRFGSRRRRGPCPKSEKDALLPDAAASAFANSPGELTEGFMRRCRRRGRFHPTRRLCGACAANPCFCGF